MSFVSFDSRKVDAFLSIGVAKWKLFNEKQKKKKKKKKQLVDLAISASIEAAISV